jgi:hypothetical protein
MTEADFRFAAVVAGVVVGGQFRKAGLVQTDASPADVVDQQVEYAVGSYFFQQFGMMSFET